MAIWQWALILLAVVWGAQALGVFLQMRHYTDVFRGVTNRYSDGFVGAGNCRGRFSKGTIAMLVVTPDLIVQRLMVMSGRSVFSRFERWHGYEDMPLDRLRAEVNAALPAAKAAKPAPEDAREGAQEGTQAEGATAAAPTAAVPTGTAPAGAAEPPSAFATPPATPPTPAPAPAQTSRPEPAADTPSAPDTSSAAAAPPAAAAPLRRWAANEAAAVARAIEQIDRARAQPRKGPGLEGLRHDAVARQRPA